MEICYNSKGNYTKERLIMINVGDLRLPLAEMEETNLNVLKQELTNFGFKF